ncbi:hypothetical protein ACT4UT_10710, partial [Bacillus sp. B-TM1]
MDQKFDPLQAWKNAYEPEQRESLENNQAKQPNSMPKNFLVPFLLLCLKDWSLHGYKLIQMLMDIGFSSVDQ